MLLPEVARMKGVDQPPEFHPEGDVWTHTLIMLEGLRNPSPSLALGVLLHDVGKPPTYRVADRIRFDGHVEAGVAIAHQILTRLRFPNDEIRQIEALIDNHMKFKDAPRMKDSTLKRFLRLSSVRGAYGVAPPRLLVKPQHARQLRSWCVRNKPNSARSRSRHLRS